MTDRTLRISAKMAEEIQQWASDELSQWPRDTAYADDLENLLAQLTAEQPAPDAVAEADAFDTFAQWFRKNYPGPDTIIHKPDWHSPRIFRAVKHAMKGRKP